MKERVEAIEKSKSFGIYRNGILDYSLMKGLTKPMNQDTLARLYNFNKEAGNPLPPNSIETWRIIEDAVKSENPELLNYLYYNLRENWRERSLRNCIITSSRAVYSPVNSKNGVIHNYGTSDSFSKKGNLAGKSGWIEDIDNPNALELLVGTKDIVRLNEVSQAVNKTPGHLLRENFKPSEETQCAVWFVAYSDRFEIDAQMNPSLDNPAFLVERGK